MSGRAAMQRIRPGACALLIAVFASSGSAAQEPASTPSQDGQPRARAAAPGLPLEPGRTVHIDRTEGSWMSLDVSPDGRTIVFDYLGDLFTIPIEGGSATQITSGLAFDAQPRFSPDGTRIAFSSDRSGGDNIWTIASDGDDPVQISRGDSHRAESPEWTPDGEYIVASIADFHGHDTPQINIFHRNGGSGAVLIDDERRKGIGAAFGADPRYLWYGSRLGDWGYNADFPIYQVWVFDRETGTNVERSSRYGSGMRPTLSPDGRWLVYGSRFEAETGLVLRDLETDSERWLAWPVQHDDQESKATLDVMPGMSFTPDSRHVVASYGGGIWKIPVDGGPAEPIPFRVTFDLEVGPALDFDMRVPDGDTLTAGQIRDAVPSPDGDLLAFTALDQVWVAEADGSNPRRVTSGDASEHHPAWSPDGRWLAYVTWSEQGGHVWKVRPDGGDARQITARAALYSSPAWSPDGERIVVLRGSARAFQAGTNPFAGRSMIDDIVWVASDGGVAHFIAPADRRTSPHFVRDQPDRIYFSGNGLTSIRWDGTDEQSHLGVSGTGSEGLNAVTIMSPVGGYALAAYNNQLYVITVPDLGGKPASISVASPSNAAFPVVRLTDDIGGEFPAWSADGQRVHWSLGNAHFTYDAGAALRGDSVSAQMQRIRAVVERDRPSGTAVLRGARAITMRGDEVIERADIVVQGNRIAAIGPSGTVVIPDGAEIIDVSARTIVPGFVDVHSHMAPVWGVHRRDQWTFAVNLAYGVTTTRDPQTTLTDVLTYADLVEAGEILGPRIFSTGPGIDQHAQIRTLDDAREVLRRYRDYFNVNTVKMYTAGNRKKRQLILMAARELGLMPTTEGSLDFRLELTQNIDGYPGHEHNFTAFPLYGDLVDLMAATGVTYTPTLMVAYGGPPGENWFYQRENVHDNAKLRRFTPHDRIDASTRRRSQWTLPDEQILIDNARFAADLVRGGGRVGIGSHGQLQGLGFHWEMWAMNLGGMPPHDVLRAATLSGAEALGLDQDLGSLAPGKLADLIVLNANPLEDLRNTTDMQYVMKNGRLYDADTLGEVYPRRTAGPTYWWWTDRPAADAPGIRETPHAP